jgi:hypothetical protein
MESQQPLSSQYLHISPPSHSSGGRAWQRTSEEDAHEEEVARVHEPTDVSQKRVLS